MTTYQEWNMDNISQVVRRTEPRRRGLGLFLRRKPKIAPQQKLCSECQQPMSSIEASCSRCLADLIRLSELLPGSVLSASTLYQSCVPDTGHHMVQRCEDLGEDISVDNDIDCGSIKIIDECEGNILDGFKQRNHNKIFWVQSPRKKKVKSRRSRQPVTGTIFDILFLGPASKDALDSDDNDDDVEKIQRVNNFVGTPDIMSLGSVVGQYQGHDSASFDWQKLRDVGLDTSSYFSDDDSGKIIIN